DDAAWSWWWAATSGPAERPGRPLGAARRLDRRRAGVADPVCRRGRRLSLESRGDRAADGRGHRRRAPGAGLDCLADLAAGAADTAVALASRRTWHADPDLAVDARAASATGWRRLGRDDPEPA